MGLVNLPSTGLHSHHIFFKLMVMYPWSVSQEKRCCLYLFVLSTCTLGNYHLKCPGNYHLKCPGKGSFFVHGWKHPGDIGISSKKKKKRVEVHTGMGAGKKINKTQAHKWYPKINLFHYSSTSKMFLSLFL